MLILEAATLSGTQRHTVLLGFWSKYCHNRNQFWSFLWHNWDSPDFPTGIILRTKERYFDTVGTNLCIEKLHLFICLFINSSTFVIIALCLALPGIEGKAENWPTWSVMDTECPVPAGASGEGLACWPLHSLDTCLLIASSVNGQ